ncbi:protein MICRORCHIDIA 7-like [Ipomoea triloba]|uniref:protein MICRORCHIDIA 7-like n=1 Tax=Ipomoea triloba TaxID=35885 RepID=UPI00125DFB2C|nr:protein MICRORCHIDIA 7-like [Ipomoea triloba]
MKVKEEVMEEVPNVVPAGKDAICISISSGSSTGSLDDRFADFDDDDDDDSDDTEASCHRRKKPRVMESVLPLGFLDPLPPHERARINSQIQTALPLSTCHPTSTAGDKQLPAVVKRTAEAASPLFQSCKQFWKAGDYEGTVCAAAPSYSVAMDHVRVHPKFLHSNATSHKWALGAFAELLDNALDEVCNGATYVNVDVLKSSKDGNSMLLVEDNGGGMNPDKMRQCMSLGYSTKSKLANTIGQYGNGFKTSSMRLGADVIVFSRCKGKDGRSPTQSIGMLSYTFLRGTGKEDIVVPMIDFEKRGESWDMMVRSSANDWKRNLETIVQWSPYVSEDDLLEQFKLLNDQGTRIIIYNLWEDDEGLPELDFETDKEDIQIKGVNRDEKKIAMAKTYPNSRHFLTYQHSLRSYASILYLKLPAGFQIILRGKDVEHHNVIHDMMISKETTYRPQPIVGDAPKDPNLFAVVTIGFAKDAKYHIDIQGFNVYHKNRLIKPFWRVWNAAGSDGRGVIGVLEANFIEPAHDKQGFERTIVLTRLENRLQYIQKEYWLTNCHLIGYAKRRDKKNSSPPSKTKSSSKLNSNNSNNNHSNKKSNLKTKVEHEPVADTSEEDEIATVECRTETSNPSQLASKSRNPQQECPRSQCGPLPARVTGREENLLKRIERNAGGSLAMTSVNGDELVLDYTRVMLLQKLTEENNVLKKSLEDALKDLQYERDRNRILENKLVEAGERTGLIDKERQVFVDKFAEERNRREEEEERLRKRLQDASDTIQELLNKVKMLDSTMVVRCKSES